MAPKLAFALTPSGISQPEQGVIQIMGLPDAIEFDRFPPPPLNIPVAVGWFDVDADARVGMRLIDPKGVVLFDRSNGRFQGRLPFRIAMQAIFLQDIQLVNSGVHRLELIANGHMIASKPIGYYASNDQSQPNWDHQPQITAVVLTDDIINAQDRDNLFIPVILGGKTYDVFPTTLETKLLIGWSYVREALNFGVQILGPDRKVLIPNIEGTITPNPALLNFYAPLAIHNVPIREPGKHYIRISYGNRTELYPFFIRRSHYHN